jgi:uncharacterized protein YprB with RNaseH-like and TPR domain
MPTTDEQREKIARLARLRKLGVKRGAHDLKAPASAPAPAPRRVEDSELTRSETGQSEQMSLRGAVFATKQSPPMDEIAAAQTTGLAMTPPATLPGEAVETPDGPAWVRTVRYALADHPELAALLEVEAEALAAAGRDPALARLDPAWAAFVDTETTGLTPDTATYTFLISIGMYENLQRDAGASSGNRCLDGDFVVRQFFMRTPAEERGQLHLVAETLNRATGLISFNGRGFDLPLMQNRFILARRPFPWLRLPHLDLLPAARRVWRGRLESCRLGSLEQHILDVRRTEEDVASFLIPDIYRQYCLSGTISDMLVRVFYHNLADITSMPRLAARLGRLYQANGRIERLRSLPGAECLSLARAYVDLGWHEAGEAAYRVALAAPLADAERGQTYRDLSYLLKRLERRAEAAALWEEWISAAPGDDVTPYVELAKYHEWHTGDLTAARGWAAWALRLVEGARQAAGRGDGVAPRSTLPTTTAELRHRLERLEKKLAGEAQTRCCSERSN